MTSFDVPFVNAELRRSDLERIARAERRCPESERPRRDPASGHRLRSAARSYAPPGSVGVVSAATRGLEPARLAAWLASGRPPQLVAALTPWQYERAHIPGSLWFADLGAALTTLRRDRPVVVYAPTEPCPAARFAEHALRSHGFASVTRLSGGLDAWAADGRVLVGAAA
jgi:rhodanese-related sulfurtransferase